jgi:hypothetical protein
MYIIKSVGENQPKCKGTYVVNNYYVSEGYANPNKSHYRQKIVGVIHGPGGREDYRETTTNPVFPSRPEDYPTGTYDD